MNEEKPPQSGPRDPDAMDREFAAFNEAHTEEFQEAYREALREDAKRIAMLKVWEVFRGRGITYESPVGEVLSFLDAELELKNERMPKGEIKLARDFLLDSIPDKWSAKTALNEVLKILPEKKRETDSGE